MRSNYIGRAAICILMTVLTAGVAKAQYEPGKGYTFEYAEGRKVNIGADMRLRLTHADRDVFTQNASDPNGPASEWLRLRTRLWATVDIVDDVQFNVRAVNRIQHYSSREGDNNTGGATWQALDEIVFDLLNIKLSNIADSGVSVTIGRQQLIFGNGMVFLEGTPRDQGRTIYFDGASATYKDESNTLSGFVFYMDDEDPIAIGIHEDIERKLRAGRILTAGAYWTHNFAKAFNTDVYYVYGEIHTTDTSSGSDNDKTELHTFGARVFGTPFELVDYSLEAAQQLGESESLSYGESTKHTGRMLDARLTFRTPDSVLFTPSVMFQYTYLSGDDPSSSGENEGWEPVFAQYPIWREELLPILFRGDWTNLNQYRVELTVPIIKGEGSTVTLKGAYAYLEADYGEGGGSGSRSCSSSDGDKIGDLFSAFIDYRVNAWLSFALEGSWLAPGNFYTDGHDCEWLRFQTVARF